jgi:GT2 family glycosyltransferase
MEGGAHLSKIQGNVVIAVPTYWCWGQEKAGETSKITYDHPTPIDRPSTLERLLDSLVPIDYPDFRILIITATTTSMLGEAAEERVRGIIGKYRDRLQIMQFASGDLAFLRERLEALGFDPALISLHGYGNVRNIQLIVSHLLGAEIVVGLDDDEVVESDYMGRATEFIGREYKGDLIRAIAGFYVDKDGNLSIQVGEARNNLFLDKGVYMNAALQRLRDEPGRVVETPIVFGGNMVLHRSLFAKIPFDPNIPRGEDIDYLINARFLGYRFWLDKELTVIHMPPDDYQTSPCLAIQQDVSRFIYQRTKLAFAQGVELEEPKGLDPYPGRFLQRDLEEHAVQALRTICPGKMHDVPSPEDFVKKAVEEAKKRVQRYFAFQTRWEELMSVVEGDGYLVEYVNKEFKS